MGSEPMIPKPCNVSWLLILGLAFGLGFSPAYGEGAKPSQKPVRAKPKVIDLDFTEDDGDITRPRTRTWTGGNPGSGQWIYWTLGASLLAGGVGWYYLEERQKEPIVTRNEQIFTDDRQ